MKNGDHTLNQPRAVSDCGENSRCRTRQATKHKGTLLRCLCSYTAHILDYTTELKQADQLAAQAKLLALLCYDFEAA